MRVIIFHEKIFLKYLFYVERQYLSFNFALYIRKECRKIFYLKINNKPYSFLYA